jgi:hypothetical protein
MDIVIDFDGTCVAHDFPAIGHDIGAVPVLKALVAAGHRLILFTMRSDKEFEGVTPEFKEIYPAPGQYLTAAVQWFKDNDIELFGIQTNPRQDKWTSSPKAYGHIYIDDAALGVPLITNFHDRPFVDWVEVHRLLIGCGVLQLTNNVMIDNDIMIG